MIDDANGPETLIDFARQSSLSKDARYTLELLIDFVASGLEDYDWDAEDAKREFRKQPGYVPDFEVSALQRAYPRLMTLEWLSFQGEQPSVVDVRPIGYLRNLTGLSLGDNEISDVGPLKHLRRLRSLYLDRNPVRDLSPLADLKHLEELSVREIATRSFAPLGEIRQLRVLAMDAEQLRALMECKRLPSLEQLLIHGHDESIFGFWSFPEMPELRELARPEVSSFDGIQRFATLCNLTNVTGDFDDLSAISALPKLTHINVLRCNASSLEPLARNQLLRSVLIRSDRVSDLGPLFQLPHLHEVSVEGRRISIDEMNRLRTTLSGWDTEFKAEHPRATPSPDLVVVRSEEFAYYDHHPFGVESWDGDRRMLTAEAEWLGETVEKALAKLLKKDEDFVQPFRVWYGRSISLCLYSERAVARFREIVLAIQSVLCWTLNEWIVYLHSDMFESGSHAEDFQAWVYREKVMVSDESAERVAELLES